MIKLTRRRLSAKNNLKVKLVGPRIKSFGRLSYLLDDLTIAGLELNIVNCSGVVAVQ
jgi:hypothetical protein